MALATSIVPAFSSTPGAEPDESTLITREVGGTPVSPEIGEIIGNAADGREFVKCVDGTFAEIGNSLATLAVVIDGGGVAISTGYKGHFELGYNLRVLRVSLMGDPGVSGNLEVDIWSGTYASPPTSSAASICGGDTVVISGSDKAEVTDFSNWIVDFSAGDVLAVNVIAASTITRATLSIKARKVR